MVDGFAGIAEISPFGDGGGLAISLGVFDGT
jgi:hypothetical protein